MRMLAIQKSLACPVGPRILVPGRVFIKEGQLKKVWYIYLTSFECFYCYLRIKKCTHKICIRPACDLGSNICTLLHWIYHEILIEWKFLAFVAGLSTAVIISFVHFTGHFSVPGRSVSRLHTVSVWVHIDNYFWTKSLSPRYFACWFILLSHIWCSRSWCIEIMALKWPIVCWCAVKKLLTHDASKFTVCWGKCCWSGKCDLEWGLFSICAII